MHHHIIDINQILHKLPFLPTVKLTYHKTNFFLNFFSQIFKNKFKSFSLTFIIEFYVTLKIIFFFLYKTSKQIKRNYFFGIFKAFLMRLYFVVAGRTSSLL